MSVNIASRWFSTRRQLMNWMDADVKVLPSSEEQNDIHQKSKDIRGYGM